jgi:hypothetical protein
MAALRITLPTPVIMGIVGFRGVGLFQHLLLADNNPFGACKVAELAVVAPVQRWLLFAPILVAVCGPTRLLALNASVHRVGEEPLHIMVLVPATSMPATLVSLVRSAKLFSQDGLLAVGAVRCDVLLLDRSM